MRNAASRERERCNTYVDLQRGNQGNVERFVSPACNFFSHAIALANATPYTCRGCASPISRAPARASSRSSRTDAQLAADFLVRQPAANEFRHLELAPRATRQLCIDDQDLGRTFPGESIDGGWFIGRSPICSVISREPRNAPASRSAEALLRVMRDTSVRARRSMRAIE